jgi:hypothetical protein
LLAETSTMSRSARHTNSTTLFKRALKMPAMLKLFVLGAMCVCSQLALAADDPAPVGVVYEGILKRFGLPDNSGSLVSTHGMRLKITKRDGEKFVG